MILELFNKTFESKARLGIMSLLMVNESVNFNSLKEILNLTDGNLATHVKALEEAGYLLVQKEFIGRKPNTLYSVTVDGRSAFEQHLSVLEQFIKNS